MERGFRIFEMSSAAQRQKGAAHLRCRQAVENTDDLTAQLLDLIRAEIDIEFARSLSGSRMRNDQQLLVETAVRCLQYHLALRDPISRLCSYLQVSRSTPERIFNAIRRTSPVPHYLDLLHGIFSGRATLTAPPRATFRPCP